MSIELSTLHLFCQDREVQSTHNGYLKGLVNLEREIKLLFDLVNSYYKEFPDKDNVPREELLRFYDLKYPMAKSRELHLDLVDTAYNTDVSPDLMKMHLDQLIEKHHATQIINKLLPVMEGTKYGLLNSVGADVDTYVDLLHNPPDSLVVPEACDLSIMELVEQEIADGGLEWHLPQLTGIIGGLRRSTLGLIYAFVDAGKTSFAMASCANFARQLKNTDERIVYCGNEEPAPRLKMRLTQALIGRGRKHIYDYPEQANDLAIKAGLDRIHVFDQVETGDQLEWILKNVKPRVAYIDQATDVEVKLGRKREGVDYFKALFKWYRKLANQHDTGMIGIAQAVGDAEDEKYLKLSQIYGTRVAVQGALDYAIGVGKKLDDNVDTNRRYINIPKNKLADGEGGKFATYFDRYLCKFEEV
jgi:hypothetical protein